VIRTSFLVECSLKLPQLLGILRSDVVGLREVFGDVVQLPHVAVEPGGLACGHPRNSMARRGKPTILVDRPISHHLKILNGANLRRICSIKGGQEGDSLYGFLLYAVDELWLRNSSCLQDGWHNIDTVEKLGT